MDTVYFLCAAIGGTILVVQTLLLLVGLGGDVAGHDADAGLHDGDAADTFFKVLSVKTLVAFVTFFGLAGLAAQRAAWQPMPAFAVSLAAGAVAVAVVGWAMTGLARLQSMGNVDLANAIGSVARVYLRIPGGNQGRGKVIVEVQGRRLECKAMTRGAEIPTGASVTVVAAPDTDTVEVQLTP